jgi:hypothetical protein
MTIGGVFHLGVGMAVVAEPRLRCSSASHSDAGRAFRPASEPDLKIRPTTAPTDVETAAGADQAGLSVGSIGRRRVFGAEDAGAGSASEKPGSSAGCFGSRNPGCHSARTTETAEPVYRRKTGMPALASRPEKVALYCRVEVDEPTVPAVNVAPALSWKMVARASVPNER